MSTVEILKFGSSVLRSASDLHVAIDEIHRRWRSGCRVLAVVSAFEGVTDELMADVMDSVGIECPEAVAAYVATGEEHTAALLQGSLHQYGLPSRLVNPREVALIAEGPLLESKPTRVDAIALERLFELHPILVLPGFYGADGQGRTSLFGRGGSLGSLSRRGARRLLSIAQGCSRSFRCRFSESDSGAPFLRAFLDTSPGGVRPSDSEEGPPGGVKSGTCGVVGFGVYETIKRYPEAFEILHVVVRVPERYRNIDRLTTDASVALDPAVDIVVVCCGGKTFAYSVILASLNAGKYVLTADKAAVASNGDLLAPYTRDERRLWYCAAVGGALPALETLATL